MIFKLYNRRQDTLKYCFNFVMGKVWKIIQNQAKYDVYAILWKNRFTEVFFCFIIPFWLKYLMVYKTYFLAVM